MLLFCFQITDLPSGEKSFLFWTDGDVLGLITNSNLVWKREEGLASISVTAIVDLPISDIEALVEEEFQEKGGRSSGRKYIFRNSL